MESELVKSFSKDISVDLIEHRGTYLYPQFLSIADSVENFEVRDDDVWVCSLPRSGTTWTQEMVWIIANDLDFEGAKVPLVDRFPFIHVSGSASGTQIMNRLSDKQLNSVEYTASLPSPRFIKAHLPFHLLPRQLREREKKSKIVYVTRNPKDTCISSYYYRKQLMKHSETFETSCKSFLTNTNYYGPFWNHVNGYWGRKDDKNILCLKYEDLKENLPTVLKKTASFLGKELNDDQVKDLERHLSFSNMQKNSAVNREAYVKNLSENSTNDEDIATKAAFIRRGCVEQWKSEMSSELIKKFDDWTAENMKKFPNLRDDFL